MSTTLNGI